MAENDKDRSGPSPGIKIGYSMSLTIAGKVGPIEARPGLWLCLLVSALLLPLPSPALAQSQDLARQYFYSSEGDPKADGLEFRVAFPYGYTKVDIDEGRILAEYLAPPIGDGVITYQAVSLIELQPGFENETLRDQSGEYLDSNLDTFFSAIVEGFEGVSKFEKVPYFSQPGFIFSQNVATDAADYVSYEARENMMILLDDHLIFMLCSSKSIEGGIGPESVRERMDDQMGACRGFFQSLELGPLPI
jgi:hypothetical protein